MEVKSKGWRWGWGLGGGVLSESRPGMSLVDSQSGSAVETCFPVFKAQAGREGKNTLMPAPG